MNTGQATASDTKSTHLLFRLWRSGNGLMLELLLCAPQNSMHSHIHGARVEKGQIPGDNPEEESYDTISQAV